MRSTRYRKEGNSKKKIRKTCVSLVLILAASISGCSSSPQSSDELIESWLKLLQDGEFEKSKKTYCYQREFDPDWGDGIESIQLPSKITSIGIGETNPYYTSLNKSYEEFDVLMKTPPTGRQRFIVWNTEELYDIYLEDYQTRFQMLDSLMEEQIRSLRTSDPRYNSKKAELKSNLKDFKKKKPKRSLLASTSLCIEAGLLREDLSPQAYLERAKKNQDNRNQALNNLALAIEADPTYSPAYIQRGVMCNDSLSDFSQDNFDLLLRRITQNPEGYRRFLSISEEFDCRESITASKNNRFSEDPKISKIVDFSRAIRHDKKNPLSYYYRGIVYYNSLLESKKATEDFSKAIELDPTDARFYFFRAISNSSNKEESKGDFQEAYELSRQQNDKNFINALQVVIKDIHGISL